MKRTLLIGLTLAVSAAFAQDQAAIDKALLAAPAQLKAGATVIKWKANYTYDTLKKGTNRLVCYDKSGMPTAQPFMVETMIGKNEATKMRKTGAVLPMPNQITASGIQASAEIGRRICTSGLIMRASASDQPRMKPIGTPSTMARP